MAKTAAMRIVVTAVACPGLALFGGCTSTVTITSDPSGAQVWIDDQARGRTPLTVPVTWWAARYNRITLEHPESYSFSTVLRRTLRWPECQPSYEFLQGLGAFYLVLGTYGVGTLAFIGPVENQHFVLAPRPGASPPVREKDAEKPGIGRLSTSRRPAEPKPSLQGLTSGALEAEMAGHFAEAVGHFEEAIRYYPENENVLNHYAWFLATVKDARFRDAERAVVLARRAAELTNEEAGHILHTLAVALHQTGKLEEAAKYAAAAAEKDPHPEVQEQARRFWEELERGRAQEKE